MKLETGLNLLRELGVDNDILEKVRQGRDYELSKEEVRVLQNAWNKTSARKEEGIFMVFGEYGDEDEE